MNSPGQSKLEFLIFYIEYYGKKIYKNTMISKSLWI